MIEYISVKEDKVNEEWLLRNNIIGRDGSRNYLPTGMRPKSYFDQKYGYVYSLSDFIKLLPEIEDSSMLWAAKNYSNNLEFLALNGIGLDIAGGEGGQLCIHMPGGSLKPFDPWVHPTDLCYAMVVSGACPIIIGNDLVIDGEVMGTYIDEELMDTSYMFGEIRDSFRCYTYEKALKDNEYMRKAAGFLFSDKG